ncbi:MAG: FkbM family methyltransferase [Tannerella sp.]|jgi:FkbM family methyltransferase|nr:FkbM family methyltransferase [Tannerella sp.]
MSIKNKLLYLRRRWFPSKAEKIQEKKYEEKILQFYKQIVYRGDLVFDIGANIGNRTIPFLRMGAKVIAVEPQEKCRKYLQKKLKKYRGGVIVPKGVGGKEGTSEFFISNATTISSFSKEWIDSMKKERFKDFDWNKRVMIEMTTLDLLIEEYGLPSFIKIDVEGYEPEVLKGLSKPVKMVSFEYAVPEQRTKALMCIELLEKISSRYVFNYSIGEDMIFHLPEWVKSEEMKMIIDSDEFQETSCGDVYAKIIIV